MSESRLVLIVDDDDAVRRTLARYFTLEGFAVAEARNGREALDVARTGGVAVILLDLRMPVMDGWTFRERQRRDASLANIPVIVVTAAPQASVGALDVDEVLTKPVDFDRLVDVIRTHC